MTESQKQKTSSAMIIGTVMTMTNACVGSALLQLSYRFAHLGVPLGLFYLLVPSAFSVWSFFLITKVCSVAKAYSLRELVERTCGKKITLLVNICTVGMYFGAVCIYVVIVSDYIHLSYNWIAKIAPCEEPTDPSMCDAYDECTAQYKHVGQICMLCVGLGLFVLESFISNIAVLSSISSIAIVCVLVTIVCIIVRVGQTLSTGHLPFEQIPWVRPDPPVPVVPELESALISFPSFFGLYSLQAFIPAYYGELKIAESQRESLIKKSSGFTMILITALYTLVAIIGPLIFNGANQPAVYQSDNILNNFSSQDTLMAVVRILYTVVIVVSFPVLLFTLRSSVCAWIKVDRNRSSKEKMYYYLIGVSICVLATLLAIAIPTISTIMDIFSAVFGLVLFQLLPLLLFLNQAMATYKLVDQEGDNESELLDSENKAEKYLEAQGEQADGVPLQELSKKMKIGVYAVGGILICVNLVSIVYTIVNLFSKGAPGICE